MTKEEITDKVLSVKKEKNTDNIPKPLIIIPTGATLEEVKARKKNYP